MNTTLGDFDSDGKEMPIDVQYYDHFTGELAHTQTHKAQKFIEHGCIEYNSEMKVFLCGPIKGYNTRTYTLRYIGSGRFSCNCQGYKKKMETTYDPFCSHILALMLYFKSKKKE